MLAEKYLEEVGSILSIVGDCQSHALQMFVEDLCEAHRTGRTVFICGNGGSSANASHLCEDLGKGTIQELTDRRLRVLSLGDNTPYILAWANDVSYESIFVEQLKNLAQPGDILIAISGSGNSPNVLRAVEWAARNGVSTWGVTGFSGGKLLDIAGNNLHVACHDMGMVESVHLTLFHWVIDEVKRRVNLE